MQEQQTPTQEEEKPKKAAMFQHLKKQIWLVLCLLILLGAGLYTAWSFRHVPTAQWRFSEDKLPWVGGNVVISKAVGEWKSASGNERLMLRTRMYPCAHFEFSHINGSGIVLFRFQDNEGKQRGDTVAVRYENGALRQLNSDTLTVQGNSVDFYLESGFADLDAYNLHQIDQTDRLWRIYAWDRPQNEHAEYYMGYTCIPVSDNFEKK